LKLKEPHPLPLLTKERVAKPGEVGKGLDSLMGRERQQKYKVIHSQIILSREFTNTD
jgi:hypothetical protein